MICKNSKITGGQLIKCIYVMVKDYHGGKRYEHDRLERTKIVLTIEKRVSELYKKTGQEG